MEKNVQNKAITSQSMNLQNMPDEILIKVFSNLGGFQLEFVSISQVINHMICYKFSALIG